MGLQEKKAVLDGAVHSLQVKLAEQQRLVEEARKALREYNEERCGMFREILAKKKKFWCGHCSQVYDTINLYPQSFLISHQSLTHEVLAKGGRADMWLIQVCPTCHETLIGQKPLSGGKTRFVYRTRKEKDLWQALLGRQWCSLSINLMDVPRPDEFPEVLARAFDIPPLLTLRVPNDFSVKLEEREEE